MLLVIGNKLGSFGLVQNSKTTQMFSNEMVYGWGKELKLAFRFRLAFSLTHPLYYLKIVSGYLLYGILFKFNMNFRWTDAWNHWSIYELYIYSTVAFDIFVTFLVLKTKKNKIKK